MTSKNKILEFVYANLKNLEDDWQIDFEGFNIWEDVEPLYRFFVQQCLLQKMDAEVANLEANTAFAFIVLSYSNNSNFLEVHKDRYDNKLKILKRLAGPSCLVNRRYQDLLYTTGAVYNEFITWYVDYQKDSRFRGIIAKLEYSASANAIAMAGTGDAKDGVDIGRMLKEADQREKEAYAILKEIETEYLNLDTLLEKENRPKATDLDNYDFMNHERFILSKRREAVEKKVGPLGNMFTDALESAIVAKETKNFNRGKKNKSD